MRESFRARNKANFYDLALTRYVLSACQLAEQSSFPALVLLYIQQIGLLPKQHFSQSAHHLTSTGKTCPTFRSSNILRDAEMKD
jgi:hypothetical protein